MRISKQYDASFVTWYKQRRLWHCNKKNIFEAKSKLFLL